MLSPSGKERSADGPTGSTSRPVKTGDVSDTRDPDAAVRAAYHSLTSPTPERSRGKGYRRPSPPWPPIFRRELARSGRGTGGRGGRRRRNFRFLFSRLPETTERTSPRLPLSAPLMPSSPDIHPLKRSSGSRKRTATSAVYIRICTCDRFLCRSHRRPGADFADLLHPPACRGPLDAAPVSADSRAHRATRVASDLIWNLVQGAEEMSSDRGPRLAVPLNDTPRSDAHSEGRAAAQATGIARMTAVDALGRVGERAHGMVCSVDALTGVGIGPYRKSRFCRFYEREVLPSSRALAEDRRSPDGRHRG